MKYLKESYKVLGLRTRELLLLMCFSYRIENVLDGLLRIWEHAKAEESLLTFLMTCCSSYKDRNLTVFKVRKTQLVVLRGKSH